MPGTRYECRACDWSHAPEDSGGGWSAARDHADEAAHAVDVWQVTSTLTPRGTV